MIQISSTQRLKTLLFIVVLFLFSCSSVGVEDNLSVIPYEGPTFTKEDVSDIWTIKEEGGEITLTHIPHGDDEALRALILTLEDVSSSMPRLIDVWQGPLSGGIGNRIRKATVEVQTWALPESISGYIQAELPTGATFGSFFWIDSVEAGR